MPKYNYVECYSADEINEISIVWQSELDFAKDEQLF